MHLGLIARADNSGLGVQCWEFARHMKPAKVLVIDVGHLHNATTHCNKATYLDRYPGAMVCKGWQPNRQQLIQFLRDLDVVVTCETTYGPDLLPLAKQMGVRTVICPNYEFLDRSQTPDLWAPPTLWHWGQIPTPKKLLPVPIALDRFRRSMSTQTGTRPTTLLHIVGRPAVYDRNGSGDLLIALQHVRSDVRVILRCQDGDHLRNLSKFDVPPNVEIVIDVGDKRDYWENYDCGDVLVMPRRYGGLCLPANEALGAGMPVVMPDISPNNTWLPATWLIPARWTDAFRAHNPVDFYTVDHKALAAKIDQFADPGFCAAEKHKAVKLAQALSWDTLKPHYEKTLGTL